MMCPQNFAEPVEMQEAQEALYTNRTTYYMERVIYSEPMENRKKKKCTVQDAHNDKILCKVYSLVPFTTLGLT